MPALVNINTFSQHNQKRLPVLENIERDASLPKVRPRSAAYNLAVTSNSSILAEMTDTEEFENDEAEEPLIIAVKGAVSLNWRLFSQKWR